MENQNEISFRKKLVELADKIANETATCNKCGSHNIYYHIKHRRIECDACGNGEWLDPSHSVADNRKR